VSAPKRDTYDDLIIGGGFFGMYIAEHLKTHGREPILIEKERDFLQRASYTNQARVHNGCHYPRSITTGLRCVAAFPRFIEEFEDCVVSDFDQCYAVGKILSKVTARQYQRFCESIGVFCEPAPYKIRKLLNDRLVEDAFLTREFAFDSVALKTRMITRFKQAGVEAVTESQVTKISEAAGGGLQVKITLPDGASIQIRCKRIFNCTYSLINQPLSDSGLPLIPLKHEFTETCLLQVPEELEKVGITIMCGPFFSVMPFPPRGVHSLHHVRYTPHCEWYDTGGKPYLNAHDYMKELSVKSHWPHMHRDIQRYVPILAESKYIDSMYEVKTVLPASEVDDSRPILFKKHCGLPNLHCIMGGKIDNIYDIVSEIDDIGD